MKPSLLLGLEMRIQPSPAVSECDHFKSWKPHCLTGLWTKDDKSERKKAPMHSRPSEPAHVQKAGNVQPPRTSLHTKLRHTLIMPSTHCPLVVTWLPKGQVSLLNQSECHQLGQAACEQSQSSEGKDPHTSSCTAIA